MRRRLIQTLYRLAGELQEQLLGEAVLFTDSWARRVSRAQLNAWASLWRWHDAGERVVDGDEAAALDRPLAPDLRLATAPAVAEAVAVALPETWIVIARHRAGAPIRLWEERSHAYSADTLTYCTPHPEGVEGLASGHVSLADQPTVADLRLIPGTRADALGRQLPLGDADVTAEEYLLALALHTLLGGMGRS